MCAQYFFLTFVSVLVYNLYHSQVLTLLTAFLWLGSGSMWGEDLTLTLMDSDWSTQYVPVDGYNLDGAQHNQLLFLSSELSDMNGGTITALTFYMDKNYTWKNNNAPTATFRFAEVTASSVASLIAVDETFQQVFSGKIVFANNEWNITLDEAYTYNGGNLLYDLNGNRVR